MVCRGCGGDYADHHERCRVLRFKMSRVLEGHASCCDLVSAGLVAWPS